MFTLKSFYTQVMRMFAFLVSFFSFIFIICGTMLHNIFEGQGEVSSTQLRWLTTSCNSSSRRLSFLLSSEGTYMHVAYTHIHIDTYV